MNTESQETSTAPAAQLSQGARTAISLLLFVQLFAIAVTVIAHTGRSELTDQIRRRVPLLQPYMRRLWMDDTYTFTDYVNPRNSAQLDSEYLIEVQYQLADGTTRSLQLPDDDIWIETRRRRYLTLARNLAAVVGNDVEAVYASMLAAGLLAEEPDAKSLELTCLERFTPSAANEPPDNPDATLREDGLHYATLYRCQAWFGEDGTVEIKKQEEARRLSPVKQKNIVKRKNKEQD